MKTIAIVACGDRGQIGHNGYLPWENAEDLKHFKDTTMGSCLIMGRKTYESIGKPLPGRKTIVISSRSNTYGKDVYTVKNPAEAHLLATFMGFEEVYVCGGGQIYSWFEPHFDEIIVSWINYSGPATAWFNIKQLEDNNYGRYYRRRENAYLLEKYVRLV